jgi:hypothetical protein
MRLITMFLLSVAALLGINAASASDVELMNSNLIARMHLDASPSHSQIVGAYIVTLRPAGDTPLSKVTVLLNPGLQFDKADSGNQRLRATTSMRPVGGMDMLELNVVEIDLGRTLSKANRTSNRDRMDIAIHFRGFIEDVSWTGLKGVKETLNPRFTMLRPESFSYPVFAEPNMEAIRKAWHHKGFYQTAAIEFPGSNTAASNLRVENTSIAGAKTKADLTTDLPTSPMIVAIGAYTKLTEGPVEVSYLDGYGAEGQSFARLLGAEVNALSNLMGPVGSKASIKVIQLPDGYASETKDALFLDSSALAASSLTDAQKASIFNLWKLNTTGGEGHWGSGLDKLLKVLITLPNMESDFSMMQFASAKELFKANSKLGKTALSDYVVDGFPAESDTMSALAFAVLHDLLGRDQFFALVRSLRAELSAGYADMASATEVMLEHAPTKSAKKFIQNWFKKGRSGKDLAKANQYGELLARYK